MAHTIAILAQARTQLEFSVSIFCGRTWVSIEVEQKEQKTNIPTHGHPLVKLGGATKSSRSRKMNNLPRIPNLPEINHLAVAPSGSQIQPIMEIRNEQFVGVVPGTSRSLNLGNNEALVEKFTYAQQIKMLHELPGPVPHDFPLFLIRKTEAIYSSSCLVQFLMIFHYL